MKNSDLLAEINAALAAGSTVYVSTMLRVTTFTPALATKLRAAGCEPFRLAKDGALLMYAGYSPKHGPRYVEIAMAAGILLVGLKFEAA